MIKILFIPSGLTTYALDTYEIELSINDENFVINDEKFEAKTYCYQMNGGDKVIFLEGNPNETCVSAELYNVSSEKKCEVWC